MTSGPTPGESRSVHGKHALLLGSAGFIGRHLAHQLVVGAGFERIELAGFHANGFPVPRGGGALGGSVLEGAVDDALLKRCSRPDVVFWAIGGASVAASVRDPAADRARTIPPLESVLRMMSGPWVGSHLIFLSSAAVYGASGSSATATTSPLRPVSPYGEHKLESERLIAEWIAPSSASIVRPFSVYGPGLKRQLLWDAMQKLGRNAPEFSGHGDELRDWAYVFDLVRLLADVAADPALFPRVLNAGTGSGVPVRELLQMLFEAAGSRERPVFTGNARPGDPDQLVADPLELGRVVDYFSTPLALGLESYCAWLVKLNLQ